MMYDRSFLDWEFLRQNPFAQYYPYIINLIITFLFKKCNSFRDKISRKIKFFLNFFQKSPF